MAQPDPDSLHHARPDLPAHRHRQQSDSLATPFPHRARRRGARVAAGVIQIVQSLLWVLISLAINVRTVISGIEDPARTALALTAALLFLTAGIMLGLAMGVLAGSNGCRITSRVLQIIFALLTLPMFLGMGSPDSGVDPMTAEALLLVPAFVGGLGVNVALLLSCVVTAFLL